MKKGRPVLSLLEVEDEVRVPSKPRESNTRVQRKHGDSDDESEGEDIEEDDDLENSCDIGETTLRKGQIQINRTGVTFVSRQQRQAIDDDPLYQMKRKVRRRQQSDSRMMAALT